MTKTQLINFLFAIGTKEIAKMLGNIMTLVKHKADNPLLKTTPKI